MGTKLRADKASLVMSASWFYITIFALPRFFFFAVVEPVKLDFNRAQKIRDLTKSKQTKNAKSTH